MSARALCCRVGIPRDVVFRDLEGEAVLLNLNTGTYFGLDAVGTRIWHLLRDRRYLLEVRDAIASEYDVTAEAFAGDLLRFVEDLKAQGLIELIDEQAREAP